MSSAHYRKLETMYRRAPVNRLYEPAIEIEDGAARVEIAEGRLTSRGRVVHARKNLLLAEAVVSVVGGSAVRRSRSSQDGTVEWHTEHSLPLVFSCPQRGPHLATGWRMIRLGLSLLVAFTAGCVGQVASSSGSGSSGTPAAVDECKAGTTESCIQANSDVGSRACEVGQEGYVCGACNPASCGGASMSCTTADSKAGIARCTNGQSASACGLAGACNPGDMQTYGYYSCEEDCTLIGGSWQWQQMPCDTPLVLAFEREHVTFTRAAGEFDLVGRDATIATDWVSASTPWLAIDLDGNGSIDDGRELFGSMTRLPGGGRASNGFVALAALDDDNDGQITERDAAFDRLVVWRDADQDRRSSPGELTSARDAGLVAIRLAYDPAPRCDDGDCEVERATFVFRDGAGHEHDGAVIDVHLATR